MPYWIAAAYWLALAPLGMWTAAQRGRSPATGLVLALLFGPLGVIVAGMLPPESPEPAAEREPARHAEPAPDFSRIAAAPAPRKPAAPGSIDRLNF